MDKDEIGEEIGRYLQAGTRIATKKLRSLQDAEDACQDAALWCLEHWSQYDPTLGTVKGWFFTKVNDCCVKQHRVAHGQGVHPRTFESLDAMPDGLLGGNGSFDWYDEKGADIRECFAVLSPRQRQVVRLKAQGYTIQEMCTKLCLHPSTVKDHLARARAYIRAELQARGYTVQGGNHADLEEP